MPANSFNLQDHAWSCFTDASESWDTLLAAARAGDDSALDVICRAIGEYLLLVASSKLGDRIRPKVAASDVAQDTLLEVCRDFSSFRGTSEREFRVWLAKLVSHNVIDSARRYRRSRCRNLDREVSLNGAWNQIREVACKTKSASSLLQRKEVDAKLLRAIAGLSEIQRKVIELRHKQGLSYANVAARLAISDVAARKVWCRAIARLRKELERDNVV